MKTAFTMCKLFKVSFIIGSFCALQACDDTGTGDSQFDEDDQLADSVTTEQHEGEPIVEPEMIDVIDLGKGHKIGFHEGPEGSIVTVTSGPAGKENELREILNGAESVLDIYKTVAPERTVPSKILSLLDNMKSYIADDEIITTEDLKALGADVEGDVDALAVQNKEASRDVDYFRDSICHSDQISEGEINHEWYRKLNTCRTEKTNYATRTYTEVRQGILSARFYRGSGGLRWQYYDTQLKIMVIGGMYPALEGQYKHIKVTTPDQIRLQFEIYNSDGDGYHYAIHTAKADYYTGKRDTGSDWYHLHCAGGLKIEACLDNAGIWTGKSVADIWCKQYYNGTPGVNAERVSGADGPVNCTETVRVCDRPDWPTSCVYQCADVCVPIP